MIVGIGQGRVTGKLRVQVALVATGNARIAVEIEVAAILARSKDRVGEMGRKPP